MLYVVFGARHPAGLSDGSVDLTRVELLGLLDALADDTRLRILEWVAGSGEQFAQGIMARFDLSQSAASRHLRQLSAAGFLVERRQGGASKAYHLNGERLREVMAALERLLLG
jgi:DNA-binding transcriptional ArsR family regulator